MKKLLRLFFHDLYLIIYFSVETRAIRTTTFVTLQLTGSAFHTVYALFLLDCNLSK
jgi:hypothetical protein